MKKLNRKKRSLRYRLQVFIYTLMRTNMVTRMRANGMSWARINRVLFVLGQKIIVRIEEKPNGVELTFAYVKEEVKTNVERDGSITHTKELPAPKIVLNR